MSYPSNKIILDRKDPELVKAPEIGSRELFINSNNGLLSFKHSSGVTASIGDEWAATAGIGNPKFTSFPAISAALAAGSRATIAFMGDSTNAGWGSNGASSGAGVAGDASNNRSNRSYPQQLAAMFKATGLPCRADAVFCTGNTSNNTSAEEIAYNPNLTLGAGWAPIGTVSIGGRVFENTTDTTALTFTPEENANNFDLLYVQNGGYATFTVTDASGTLDTVNSAGSLAVIKRTVSRTLASKLPISIQRNGTGTNLRLIAIVPYDTTEPMLEMWNMGAGGFQTSNWLSATTAVAHYNAMIVMPPTQWIIELGANDQNAAVSDATFEANLGLLVDRAITVAPTSLVIPPASRDNSGSYNIPAGYLTAITNVKTARPAMTPTIDIRSKGGFLAVDYFDSSVHMTKSGYKKRALVVQKAFA